MTQSELSLLIAIIAFVVFLCDCFGLLNEWYERRYGTWGDTAVTVIRGYSLPLELLMALYFFGVYLH